MKDAETTDTFSYDIETDSYFLQAASPKQELIGDNAELFKSLEMVEVVGDLNTNIDGDFFESGLQTTGVSYKDLPTKEQVVFYSALKNSDHHSKINIGPVKKIKERQINV